MGMNATPGHSLKIPVCPPAGQGVHHWTLSAANACRAQGLSQSDAERVIYTRSAGCGRSLTKAEVAGAIAKAYDTPYQAPRVRSRKAGVNRPAFEKLAKGVPDCVDQVIIARSPLPSLDCSNLTALNALYDPGEKIAVISDRERKKPRVIVSIPVPEEPLPDYLARPQKGQGTLFQVAPVDGKQGADGSWRNEARCTRFPYVLLESDSVPVGEFLWALAQLPFPIAMLTTSGGKSVHALLRVGATTKDEWEKAVQPLRIRAVELLGVDPAAIKAVQLSRLPGAWRDEKGGWQECLYLDPNPDGTPIKDKPTSMSEKVGPLQFDEAGDPVWEVCYR